MNVVNLEKAGDDGERADGDDHQHGGAGPTEQGWEQTIKFWVGLTEDTAV